MKKLFNTLIITSITLTAFGQSATVLSTFEDQNFSPEIGSANFEKGTSGDYAVVPNPHRDAKNSSDYVLKVFTEPGTGGRAEYSIHRMETNEKTYFYTWKRFFPEGMWKDVDRWFCLMNQWKTWPCESGGKGEYAKFDELICPGAGIFNDMELFVDGTIDYRARANPNCKTDYSDVQEGIWYEFTLEVYWTNSDSGYYRIWKNDTLFGYGDNMKTLFDEFIEGTCNIYWTTGLYTGWSKKEGMSTDLLVAYLDDVAIYDKDSSYTIDDVCPTCEAVPTISTDSSIYKINVNGNSSSTDGYNNYIVSWNGDIDAIDLTNTFGQNNGIDIYLPSNIPAIKNNNLSSDCFPDDVITTHIGWTDATIYTIKLKDLDPSNSYVFKLLSATNNSGSNHGVEIWTTEENKDIVLASGNTCDMAEITNLVSDKNGDLTINVASIGGTAYINSIEIVEYNCPFDCETENLNNELFPNPVKDILYINVGSVPLRVTIYTANGRKVKYIENMAEINVSVLPRGIYMATIETEESRINRKFIKE